jgi:hypothetical protein
LTDLRLAARAAPVWSAETKGRLTVPLQSKLFHRHEHMGDVDAYYFARDPDTSAVFILHKWSRREGAGSRSGVEVVELDTFLMQRGTAQDRFRELIGTLVTEIDNGW